MKKFGRILLALPFFLLASKVFAIDYRDLVSQKNEFSQVYDLAEVLNKDEYLENTLDKFGFKTSVSLVVVTIDDLPEDYTIDTIAVELFEDWGIGNEYKDNGLLFIISVNDRKFRIEVGYGLEGVISDIIAKNIAEKNFIPNFRAGDYDKGVEDAIQDAEAIIGGDELLKIELSEKAENGMTTQEIIYIIFIIWAVVSSFVFSNPGVWINHGSALLISFLFGGELLAFVYLVVALLFMLIKLAPPVNDSNSSGSSGFGGFGGGGSSGGFGGFGGGMSGGGGFSGGW